LKQLVVVLVVLLEMLVVQTEVLVAVVSEDHNLIL
jgi:hypothetical protein